MVHSAYDFLVSLTVECADGFVLRTMRIGLDVGAGAMVKPDDVTGHAAHFGGYLAGWAVKGHLSNS